MSGVTLELEDPAPAERVAMEPAWEGWVEPAQEDWVEPDPEGLVDPLLNSDTASFWKTTACVVWPKLHRFSVSHAYAQTMPILIILRQSLILAYFTHFTSFGGGKLELLSSSVAADESELCTAAGEDTALEDVEAVADL